MPVRRTRLHAHVARLNACRAALAGSLAKIVPDLSAFEIQQAAQRIVHRLVFIKFLQDQAIHLNALLGESTRLPPLKTGSDVQAVCQQLATRFPHSIFQPHPTIDLSSQPCLGESIFSTTTVDWEKWNFHSLTLMDLGAIYEQHLPSHNSRKHQGVYYTPKYVVDYIVEHTLGPLLAGKSSEEIASLRVADIACGAGAFLLGAYDAIEQHLIAWHQSHPTNQQAIERVGDGWRLSPCNQSQILQNNLFAVDLDPQAVEVAKMILHLRLLLSCSNLRQACLPALEANIQCGNALVGEDYADHDDDRTKLVPLDWPTRFPAVMRTGGFHAILGNPPYVNIRLITQSHGPRLKAYFREHFTCAQRGYDLYVLFLEQAFRLLQPGGRCGMIVPNKLATLDYATACRELLGKQTCLERIADLSSANVFPAASVYPYILVWSKQSPSDQHQVTYQVASTTAELTVDHPTKTIHQRDLHISNWRLQAGLEVESRVPTVPLATIALLHSGTTGFSAEQMANLLVEQASSTDEHYQFIVSGNVDRYRIELGNVRFMNRHFSRPTLARQATEISDRKHRLYASPKIIVAGMTKRLEAAYDANGLALGVQLFAVVSEQVDKFYLLGLLNSKLLSYLFRTRFPAKQLAGGFLAINKGQLAQLPIRSIITERDQAIQDDLSSLGKGMSRETSSDIDVQIDALVYELYQLTADEIAQVEAGYTA